MSARRPRPPVVVDLAHAPRDVLLGRLEFGERGPEPRVQPPGDRAQLATGDLVERPDDHVAVMGHERLVERAESAEQVRVCA